MIPISFREQILPGTFEPTLSHLIDHGLDLSVFDERYCNDDTGRPAYDPALLLKIVLYAYPSHGVIQGYVGVAAVDEASFPRGADVHGANHVSSASATTTPTHVNVLASSLGGMEGQPPRPEVETSGLAPYIERKANSTA